MLKDFLGKLKWREARNVLVVIENKGSPGDRMVVPLESVVVGKQCLEIGHTMVPYHRVKEISESGKLLWHGEESE